jgi:signal transduction histidine kinase
MLSTLAIISIFTEIFAGTILASGAYSFLKRFIQERKRGDAYLSAVFILFAVYIALIIASQLMYNVQRPVVELIVVQKFIHFSLTACSLALFLFMTEKFALIRFAAVKALSVMLGSIILGMSYCIFISQVSLVFRREIIEPVVNFTLPCPSRLLWVLMWGSFFAVSLFNTFKADTGRRNLLLISAASSFLIVAAYALRSIYLGAADPIYLLLSWIIMLFATIGLLLGEIIPPQSRIALSPFTFFKTRLLYKLILIFVLLIVVLLEFTTLITINISRNAMISETKDQQRYVARSVADKIEFGGMRGGRLDAAFVRQLVVDASEGGRVVYVINSSGRIIAHPQPSSVGRDLTGVESVKKVLRGEAGSLEYLSPLFIVPQDKVVGGFAPVKGASLGVIVEEPEESAYGEIRKVETNSLIFVMAGIMLTMIVGIFFANSIERPIREVIAGTEAVRRGNLSRKININSEDEIGQLAQAFNQMTDDLRDTQEHLVYSEKLASLGTMAAGMAHEIKNPLVSLRTFTQLLQQKFDDPEFRNKFSAIVPQEIEHINRIAESLLKFGKPTKPEFAKTSVNKLIEEVLALLENECRRNNVRVTTKLAALPDITADPMQLSQAFVNIVLNAIQAMPQGGELTVKSDVGEVVRLGRTMRKGMVKTEEGSYREGMLGEVGEGVVSELYNRPVPVVFLEITDTGGGIEEGNLKKLFDPFYTTKISGTGMGLPITLRIIEDHNGSIKVKSKVGKGTTFIVTLPQKREEA